MRILQIVLIVICSLVSVLLGVFIVNNHQTYNEATAQVKNLADELDSKTKENGVYERDLEAGSRIVDPWGMTLKVVYSQGGFSEMISVSSAGCDRRFGTSDDIIAKRNSVNLKGVGTGVQDAVNKVAHDGASGVVTGVVDGVKESFPFKKKSIK